MSRYEWEKGEFVIPSAFWAEFKAKVRDAVNASSRERMALALKIHAHMAGNHRSLRGYELCEEARRYVGTIDRASAYVPPRYSEADIFAAIESIQNEAGRLRKPLKKDFPVHGNNVASFRDQDCYLEFDNETRKVTWEVFENNHACDAARDSALGKAFFEALRAVRWTRGSGGRIWGNDEYNADSGRGYAGGGGSYNKMTYGPDERPQAPTRPIHGNAFFRGPRW